jgi:hypothetical protein
MLRLGRVEQVAILEAAMQFPQETIGKWITAWVAAQQRAGTSGSIDISTIPIPLLEESPLTQVDLTPVVDARVKVRQERDKERQETDERLKAAGITDKPKHVRKAMRKFTGAYLDEVKETERYPDTPECWLGDHDMDENEETVLWVVGGYWVKSERQFEKWGCGECAEAIRSVHSELDDE